MRFLINASNLRQGGGIQVADSFCQYLDKYPHHHFDVVLPPVMEKTLKEISSYSNVSIFSYCFKNSIKSLLFQRDTFLDTLVEEGDVNAVLTIFGPSRWRPTVPHLSGFARGQILPMNTPYLTTLSFKERMLNHVIRASFAKSADFYWTENPAVSYMLSQILPGKRIFTVSNSYNQVFDDESRWREHRLPDFDGITLLTITNSYPHKNLALSIGISRVLEDLHPDLKFRFVFTISKSDFPELEPKMQKHFELIGKVDISECPSLYQQADIMFQPSLIECFTATYPEAMRMGVPIVTSDLDFARCLCADAALYFSPLSAEDAADKIYSLYQNPQLRTRLTDSGYQQLSTFLNAEERSDKIISILESITYNNSK